MEIENTCNLLVIKGLSNVFFAPKLRLNMPFLISFSCIEMYLNNAI